MEKNSPEYKAVDEALSALKVNVLAGIRVPKKQWPRVYLRKYGIRNLYKYDLARGRRLTYAIVAEQGETSVVVLDYFASHEDYEIFFGY